MIEQLEKMDNKILSYIEKFCHKFQKLTGRTNFFIAKIVAYFMLASLLCNNINFYTKILVDDTPIFAFITNGILSLLIFFDLYQYDLAERDKFRQVKQYRIFIMGSDGTLGNRFMLLIRILYFVFAIIAFPRLIKNLSISNYKFFEIISYLYEIEFILLSYLISITPLPPSKSQISEFISNIFHSKILIPQNSKS